MDVWTTLDHCKVRYRYRQIATAFLLDGREYPSGSWLVQRRDEAYAHAVTQEDFIEWHSIHSSPASPPIPLLTP